jgi:hypothetical protein
MVNMVSPEGFKWRRETTPSGGVESEPQTPRAGYAPAALAGGKRSRASRPPGHWRTRSLIRASVAARSWPSASAKPPLCSDSARRLFRVPAQ